MLLYGGELIQRSKSAQTLAARFDTTTKKESRLCFVQPLMIASYNGAKFDAIVTEAIEIICL